jgi:DNA helicase-2/ATP-dependent DNA helicase PcrA
MASEPSQFLNEIPPELIEDLTRGPSWLSFARNSSTLENKHAVQALRGETRPVKSFSGKTYNTAESIAEFFNRRRQELGGQGSKTKDTPASAQGSVAKPAAKPAASEGIVPGSYVKHPKYGRGLVLRREGAGDAAKLTVSFPGYGQKKLIEKYAGLEKA